MTEATINPLSGLWKPTHLKALYYGPDSVSKYLLDCLPSESSKAFIVTGSSLANKTSLISDVEKILGAKHAATFSKIGQHAPVADLDQATEIVQADSSVDTVISIGGGSPIDSAKVISYRNNETNGKFLYHITIPTTLSAAECTSFGGYTNEQGVKTGVGGPECAPHVVIYDAKFALETPPSLWMSTALRAMDHAVECLYHPTATELMHLMALQAVSNLFVYLPRYKRDPKDIDNITQLQLAAFASLGFMGMNMKGSLGLSHTLGYALGSPYQIPHGVTSCLTLGHVIKLKSEDPAAASAISRLLPFIGGSRTGNDRQDAEKAGDMILKLVSDLGLKTTLTEKGVGKDQVPIIIERATGGMKSGPLYDKVKTLVEGLY
jgi:alcohol dehydrogenase class IV